MKLIIVRHSISQQNANHIISGSQSNPDLSKEGIELVKKASQYVDEDQIDLVYTTSLKRAQETAKILTDNKKKLHIDDRIAEMDFGSWDGKDDRPIHKKYPEIFDFEGMFTDQYVKYAKNGESFADLTKRCKDFLDDLKKTAGDKTVMLVFHGFAIRGMMAAIFGIDPMAVTSVKNVSFTEVAFDQKNNFKPRLMTFNRDKPAYFAVKIN